MRNSIAWTIAGSDSGGISGVQADLHTFHNFGVHGCCIITAITAQNSAKFVDSYYLSPKQIATQISAIEDDLPPKAIKIGMMGNADTINEILTFLKRYTGKAILDPLLISTSGGELFASTTQEYILLLKKIFPFVELITPNLKEAEKITGQSIRSYQDMKLAADLLLKLGAKSVLLKGGHFPGDILSQDYWTNGTESFWIANQRYQANNYRGIGCALSSSITAALALGYDLKDAIVIGKMYITQGIRNAQKYGQALIASMQCSQDKFSTRKTWPENFIDLPFISQEPLVAGMPIFPNCGEIPLGLYPIVDSVEWLQKLLPVGVKTIQLRIKNKQGSELENEIKQGIQLAKEFQVRLFINDYWELALRFGAYGVHLGQEDLSSADIGKIHAAGLRLGVSSGNYFEVAKAHTLKPSYIACGPIFKTDSKKMKLPPQGLEQLRRWHRTLNYPLVAIGGIDSEKLIDVLATHVDGVAMISAITKNKNPIAMIKQLLDKVTKYQACRNN